MAIIAARHALAFDRMPARDAVAPWTSETAKERRTAPHLGPGAYDTDSRSAFGRRKGGSEREPQHTHNSFGKNGVLEGRFRDSNPRPPAPKAGIIPLDQIAVRLFAKKRDRRPV